MRAFISNILSPAFLLHVIFAACIANIMGSATVGLAVWSGILIVFRLKNG